jgi:glycosyltransferase involved in cell wall biosynthesis
MIALVPLPPPLNGLSLASQQFIEQTRPKISWDVYSVSRTTNHRWAGQWSRFARSSHASWRCLATRRDDISAVYMAMNAGITKLYNLAFVMICKAKGLRVILHHNSYAYIDRKNSIYALIQRFLKPRDLQIYTSDVMKDAVQSKYRPSTQSLVLTNSYVVPYPAHGDSTNSPAYRIGHLSNLTIEKGLKTVLELATELKQSGQRVELHLAGPCHGDQEKALIALAQQKMGADLITYGPVYGPDKDRFFRNIDVFWFPTEYRVEAHPIVLLESLSYGVPCLSMERGCIPWILGAESVARDRDRFVDLARLDAVGQSSRNQSGREASRARFAELKRLESDGFHRVYQYLEQEDS